MHHYVQPNIHYLLDINPSLVNMCKYTFKIITMIAVCIKYVMKKLISIFGGEHSLKFALGGGVQSSDPATCSWDQVLLQASISYVPWGLIPINSLFQSSDFVMQNIVYNLYKYTS